jgi:hypothetical protein
MGELCAKPDNAVYGRNETQSVKLRILNRMLGWNPI